MSEATTGGIYNQRFPVVLLTWYNSLVLSGSGSMEFSITTVELPGCGVVSLNPGDGTTGPSEWRNTVSDEGLVEFSGLGNM